MDCKVCGLDNLSPKDFYKGDKHICKKCKIVSSIDWQKNNPSRDLAIRKRYRDRNKEKQRIFYREWYKKNGRERAEDYADVIAEWAKNNPEGVKARIAIQKSVARGDIKKPKKCQQCDRKVRLSAHHEDYSRTLDVIWLCSSCHKRVHSGDLKIST